MQETDQLRLQQRNAELEVLVTELKSQLQAHSVQEMTVTPKAVSPSRADTNSARSTEWKIAKLEHKIEQLQAEVSRRRREQETLKNSEQRYRSVIEAMREAVMLLNADGVIETCNASAAEILESTVEELVDRSLLDFDWKAIHEDGSPFEPEDFPGLITAKTGIPCSEVVMGLCKPENQITWISINAQPLSEQDQILPYGVVISFSDISLRRWIEQERMLNVGERLRVEDERKQAAAELQESEERFRQLAENIQQIFWMYDVECKKWLYISPASQQVLGYDSETCYEKSLSFWINRSRPEDIPHLMRVSREALRGKPTEATFGFCHKDGVDRWLRARAFPVRNPQGKIYRIAGIAEDITEAKTHETERREQEQRLRLLESVIVNASDAVVITEAEPVEPPGPRIIYVNDAFTKMLGYERDEVIGKTPRILQGPKTDWTVLKNIRTALKNWEPAIAELVNYHKDGSEVWIELSIFPVTDQTGHYTYWVGLQRDITHRKQAEIEMRKALEKERELSDLKSNFVSTVSHEFRTPLSTILSSADMLEFYAGECSIEKQLEHIQRIQIASLNMKDLLSDVLVLERAEARKVKFAPAPLNILAFCENLVDEMQINDQNQHQLMFEPETTLPEIRGYMDAKLMRQILTNLLSNALKYSPAGAIVFLRLSHDETHLYFEVQDQGIGIPISDQTRLFEAFHRARNVGTISGNGLGLAIVKQSVDFHQGQIHLTSLENEGTIVQVTLPLQPDA